MAHVQALDDRGRGVAFIESYAATRLPVERRQEHDTKRLERPVLQIFG
jgi:hypothetical protein